MGCARGTVPDEVTAVQGRIDMLGQRKNRKLRERLRSETAKPGQDATSQWSKAQGASAMVISMRRCLPARTPSRSSRRWRDFEVPAPGSRVHRAFRGTGELIAPANRADPPYSASCPSLTITAPPPMCAAASAPSSISSRTSICEGRFM